METVQCELMILKFDQYALSASSDVNKLFLFRFHDHCHYIAELEDPRTERSLVSLTIHKSHGFLYFRASETNLDSIMISGVCHFTGQSLGCVYQVQASAVIDLDCTDLLTCMREDNCNQWPL